MDPYIHLLHARQALQEPGCAAAYAADKYRSSDPLGSSSTDIVARLLRSSRMREDSTLPDWQQSQSVRLQEHGADIFGTLQAAVGGGPRWWAPSSARRRTRVPRVLLLSSDLANQI